MKTCTICGRTKSIEDFHKIHKNEERRRWACKSCCSIKRIAYYKANKSEERRKSKKWKVENPTKVYQTDRINKLKKYYGMTVEDFDKMLNLQENKCKICKQSQKVTQKNPNGTMCVDHCHTTGKVRGLLCDRCNRGLGFFRDSSDNLNRAAEYLKGSL